MQVNDRRGVPQEVNAGDRVAPRGRTKDNLTYGYVRAVYWENGREYARVFWPQIASVGDRWTASDLVWLGRATPRNGTPISR